MRLFLYGIFIRHDGSETCERIYLTFDPFNRDATLAIDRSSRWLKNPQKSKKRV